jgi:hypothetical protein
LQNNFGWSDKQDTNLSGQVTEIVKLEDVLWLRLQLNFL